MRYWFLFFLLFFSYEYLLSQVNITSADSSLKQLAYEYTRDQYVDFMQRQAQLYSGSEYPRLESAIDGHQFLYSRLWEEADIRFGQLMYKNVDARYDLFRDLLIIKHFDQSGRMVSIIPDQDMVQSFHIHGEYFIRLDGLDSLLETPKSGVFYHVIKSGRYPVLSKKIKIVTNSTSASMSKEFREKFRYYIIKDNIVHPIRGRGSFLKLFPEYKKELKRFARDSGLYFSRHKELFLIRVTDRYETMTANP